MNAHSTAHTRLQALHAIRDTHTGTSAQAQRQRLLEAMQSLGHVSTFEASRHLDIYFPPARKLELLKQGFPVGMVRADVETESGERHRVGLYFLERE